MATTPGAPPRDLRSLRVLIATNRHLYRLVSYGMIVDFENAVACRSDADILPVPLPSLRRRLTALRAGRPLRRVSAPRRQYDICVFIAMGPEWLPSLEYIRNLRTTARRVVVYLFDSWLSELDVVRRHQRALSLVDDVFISFPHALTAYEQLLDCRVHYLPQAIEPRWFHADRPQRPIDVLSIGRRLESVHERLLHLAQRDDLFYFYQTAQAPQAIDLMENQWLLGRLCQSAQTHVSWAVEATNPKRAGEGSAITARWFESAASGAVVIGSRPGNPEFARLFPYDGFVRDINPNAEGDIDAAVAEALADPASDQRHALAEHVRREHTWGKRWHEIVEMCGI